MTRLKATALKIVRTARRPAAVLPTAVLAALAVTSIAAAPAKADFRIDIGGDGFPVHRQRNGRHRHSSSKPGPNGPYFTPDLRSGIPNLPETRRFSPISVFGTRAT